MKALIIDDERLAREELRELLAAHPEIEIVGEAANGPEAQKRIAELQPDLLFLDIQMPEQNGFELLQSLEPPVPEVIFVTAYDKYALQAFENSALDYLVKPVEPERLARAIGRLHKVEAATGFAPAAPSGALTAESQVFVREGDRCWFVALGDIVLFEAEGSSTRVFFGGHKPVLPRALTALEARLPADRFFRINRSQIVNLKCIESIEPWFSRSLRAKLKGGLEVEFSRRQSLAFREAQGL
ncbi:MAG TPA: LytTR family DNA-binding domain-containing protein [Opitutaceae bacterium]|nr:LytTR family DNA-binding domain-containing protein [Opitutaceae bacterium]